MSLPGTLLPAGALVFKLAPGGQFGRLAASATQPGLDLSLAQLL